MYILSNNKIKKSYDCPICGYYYTDSKAVLIETTTHDSKYRTYKVGDTLYLHGDDPDTINYCTFSRTDIDEEIIETTKEVITFSAYGAGEFTHHQYKQPKDLF